MVWIASRTHRSYGHKYGGIVDPELTFHQVKTMLRINLLEMVLKHWKRTNTNFKKRSIEVKMIVDYLKFQKIFAVY
jgi:hypothetical protein